MNGMNRLMDCVDITSFRSKSLTVCIGMSASSRNCSFHLLDFDFNGVVSSYNIPCTVLRIISLLGTSASE